MGLGFLNQPFHGCPEEEGKQGPGFADYTASPWSPVAGLLFAIFFQRHSGFLLPFFFLKLLVFAAERKDCLYVCGDRWAERRGRDSGERDTEAE